MRLFSGILPLAKPRRSILSDKRLIESVRLDDVTQKENLRQAWRKVRANKGGPGGDGVSIEEFGAKLDENLGALADELLRGDYRPRRLRSVRIAKPAGGYRQLRIPAVRDRIAQAALLIVLAPVIDPRLSDASWAYRPGRGVQDALAVVRTEIAAGHAWVVEADIKKFFDEVPHRRLIEELTIWIDDERLISVVRLWVRSASRAGKGIPQGSPISPMLANIYLHPVDRLLGCDGHRVIRYADDLLILTKTEDAAKSALRALGELLRLRGLSLKVAKTRIAMPGQTITFLGEVVRGDTV